MKLKANKKIIGLSLSLVIMAVFLLISPVRAGVGDVIGGWGIDLLSGICNALVSALGWVLVQIMSILVYFAQYNGFITSAAVVNGWVIVRDVCNMFFVLILLVIAFATILQVEEYNYKKWLPKLILMAVLINFSKTICGLLIDAAQIVMLTFVNSFKDIVGANLTSALGIADWQKISDTGANNWEVAAVLILAVIYVVIAIIVVSAMLAMIAMRIVMIWIYVVLSPIAYLMAAFPAGKSYSSKWWSQFTQNLVVGPVLAFFIWLSFTSLASFSSSEFMQNANKVDNSNGSNIAKSTPTTFGTSNTMVKFIIAIGMLLGGMRIAQEIGGDAAKAAGSVFNKGNNFAIGAAKGAGKLLGAAAMLPVNHGVDKLQEKGIVDLNLKRAWNTMQTRRKDYKAEQYASGLEAAGKRMNQGGLDGAFAMTAAPSDAYDRITDWKGIKPVGILKQIKGENIMAENKEEGIREKNIAERQLQNHNFNNKFVNADAAGRNTLIDDATLDTEIAQIAKGKSKDNLEAIRKDIEDEEKKGEYKDTDKINELRNREAEEKENFEQLSEDEAMHSTNLAFANKNINRSFTDEEKFKARKNVKTAQNKVDKAENKIADNIPMDTRQALIAEQNMTSKKMSELKDITDPTELLRMLKTSISGHDKSMVKAIMLKMAKDGNDNEFLQPLAGRTDHLGLKNLMKQLSTKGSANYAGFHEQEAFGLGSQVAEINKGTNHWGATSAYMMENGKWRETTNKEHHEIRDIETGKQQLQAFIRNNNRLAYGYHDAGGTFHLDAGGVLKLQSINNYAGHKNIDTMNESAATHVYQAIISNDKLRTLFSKLIESPDKKSSSSLLQMLEARIGSLASNGSSTVKLNAAEELLRQ